jgi:hypothetical protein
MDAREETTDAPGMQQWNKRWRLKGAATAEEAEDILQDLQEGCHARYREVKGRAFGQDSKNE